MSLTHWQIKPRWKSKEPLNNGEARASLSRMKTQLASLSAELELLERRLPEEATEIKNVS